MGQRLTAPAVGPVAAGTVTDFEMPIAPKEVNITSPLPAGATINARVINQVSRPARPVFVAPDAVSAPTTVMFAMIFRSEADPAIQRPVPVNVDVNPKP